MTDKLFEPYYKRGFDHFVFKRLMHLKRPRKGVRRFYFGLITIILALAFLLG